MWGRFEIVFKIFNPIKTNEDYLMRIGEPMDWLGVWNLTKKPLNMQCSGNEKLFEGNDEFETWQGFVKIKQKRKLSYKLNNG